MSLRKRMLEELDQDIRDHIERETQDNIARGMPPEEARYAALRKFGSVTLVKEETREVWTVRWLEELIQDVRFGLRMLRKSRGFTIVAVLTLALGIGANTALFSVVNGVLLNPLPFPRPEELVALDTTNDTGEDPSISYPNFLDWQKDTRTLTGLAAYRREHFNLTGIGEPERLTGQQVSANFFPTLGIKPILGRTFEADEDRLGANPVVLIGNGLWKRKYGSPRDVVGRTMDLNGRAYTIVGVVPATTKMFEPAEVFVPIGQWDDPSFLNRRFSLGTRAIARLMPGVTLAQARADMDGIARNLAAAYPVANGGSGTGVVPLKQDRVRDVKGFLLVLLGAVGFVLLISCANVANLLLARSTGRTREFAIRTALGQRPLRAVRQLLTESVLLGIAGGAIGLLASKWATSGMIAALPESLPRADEIRLDSNVLLFTLAVSILTGVIFGLVPALKVLQPDIQGTLQQSGRGCSGVRHRTQRIFVAAEMALAVVLLVGAGLMIRSLASLWKIDPGFNPRNVVSYGVSWTSSTRSTAEELRARYRAVERAFEDVPGVVAVSPMASAMPMADVEELPFWLDGQPKPANDNDAPATLFYVVTPGYTKAMGIPLQRGRLFDERDDEHTPAVVLIDSTFARRYFPDQDPIGKHLNLALMETHPEIIGVVGHVEQWGLGASGQDVQAEIYLPLWQIPDRFWSLIRSGSPYVARTQGTPLSVVNALRHAATQVDRTAAIYEPQPMDDLVADSVANRRFSMLLLSVFAGLALLLSAIGIYGVVSYLAGQRAREIGIRMALGAQRHDVLWLVLGEGAAMAAIGVVAGVAAALAVTRLMANMIYGVSARDPLTFAGVAAVLLAVGLAACYVPARRAMRVDPMVALRYE